MRPLGWVPALGALVWGGAPAWAQQADALLARCAENASQACLTTSVQLDVEAARRLAAAPAAELDSAWKVRLRGAADIAAFGRRMPGEGTRPARILVLVDVSGSMQTLGIGTAKIALKDNLLRSLSSLAGEATRVAVAPFGSVDLGARIEGARFVTPAEAIDQIEALPAPDRENTGLYSAVEAGISRLGSELPRAGPDALGILVVLTDGNNDVDHPGDDPGLLAGEDGLATAARAVERSSVIAAVIGLGDAVDPGPLRVLAGPRGRSYVVPLDAFELARPLDDIRSLLASTWELAVPVPTGGREELGRGWATVSAQLALGGGPVATAVAVWRPPVMALPAFSGVVLPGVIPVAIASQLGGGGVIDRRVPLGLFLAILLALLWTVVPRLLWPRLQPAGAPAAGGVKAGRPAGGLRTDLKEAAPRRPEDVTASRARVAG